MVALVMKYAVTVVALIEITVLARKSMLTIHLGRQISFLAACVMRDMRDMIAVYGPVQWEMIH